MSRITPGVLFSRAIESVPWFESFRNTHSGTDATNPEHDSQRRTIMEYCFAKTVTLAFEQTVEKVTEALKKEGFGIITEIDIKETLKKKLDVEFGKYRILGACNPRFAYKALQAEPRIGVFLPCNVIVRDLGDGKTEVAAINPMENMRAVNKPELGELASEVESKLRSVVESV
jgi:uncharacterized protein (DUF302 family)